MKTKISETQILTTVRLSEIQKAVLAKITAAASPEVAHSEISDDRNFVGAHEVLVKLGLADITDATAAVTEKGKKVMKDENLIDDAGQLNNNGKRYVGLKSSADAPPKQDAGNAATTPSVDDLGGDGPPDEPTQKDPVSFNEGQDMPLLRLLEQDRRDSLIIGDLFESNTFSKAELTILQDVVDDKHDFADLPFEMLDKLYDYVYNYDPSWMPHNVVTGDDDTYEWLFSNLDDIVRTIVSKRRI